MIKKGRKKIDKGRKGRKKIDKERKGREGRRWILEIKDRSEISSLAHYQC